MKARKNLRNKPKKGPPRPTLDLSARKPKPASNKPAPLLDNHTSNLPLSSREGEKNKKIISRGFPPARHPVRNTIPNHPQHSNNFNNLPPSSRPSLDDKGTTTKIPGGRDDGNGNVNLGGVGGVGGIGVIGSSVRQDPRGPQTAVATTHVGGGGHGSHRSGGGGQMPLFSSVPVSSSSPAKTNPVASGGAPPAKMSNLNQSPPLSAGSVLIDGAHTKHVTHTDVLGYFLGVCFFNFSHHTIFKGCIYFVCVYIYIYIYIYICVCVCLSGARFLG
jgi:hypothetical protein